MRTTASLHAMLLLASLVVCAALNGALPGLARAGATGDPRGVQVPSGAPATSASVGGPDVELQNDLLRRSVDRVPGLRLHDVFARKASVARKLKRQKQSVLNNFTLASQEKQVRLRDLEIKLSHLESLEALGYDVLKIIECSLNETDSAAFDNIAQLSSLVTQLQFAALKAQAEINTLEREKKENDRGISVQPRERLLATPDATTGDAGGTSGGVGFAAELVGEVLHEVSSQADRLEDGMRDDVFVAGRRKKGSSIETVVKVPDGQDEEGEQAVDLPNRQLKVGTLTSLIDYDNNQYVLAKPSDLTVHYDDVRFLHDLICILLLSFACGYVCSFFNMPPFFGYVIAGCMLGPSGFNVIRAVVQTEALAQLGVMFIIFVLGVEFSFERISKIWGVAVGGTISMLATMIILFCILAGAVGQSAIGEATFVGACVSLSSTAVVVKSVKSDDLDIMCGILVMQDLLLGLMLAILPTVEKSGPDVMRTVGNLLVSLVTLTALTLMVLRVPTVAFLRQIKQSGQHELFLLAVLCVCLLMLKLAEFEGLGVELGCFLAGVVISSSPPVARAALAAVEPVRDLFLCFFFATVGMHVYPSFLASEMLLVLTLAAGAVGFKWVVTTAVLMVFRFDFTRASVMALGLAQISEFAFVLCSRAKAMRIISREVYYLLLATTSLTLLATPVLLRTVLKGNKDCHLPFLKAAPPTLAPSAACALDFAAPESLRQHTELTTGISRFAKLLEWLPAAPFLTSDYSFGWRPAGADVHEVQMEIEEAFREKLP